MKETNKQLQNRLSAKAYQVTQYGATEEPFTGEYYKKTDDGMYRCVVCNEPLFNSATKFESGSGWPSFYDIANSNAVEMRTDTSLGMTRTEVICGQCGAHLGHLFLDMAGTPTEKRYCINSCALSFEKQNEGGAGKGVRASATHLHTPHFKNSSTHSPIQAD